MITERSKVIHKNTGEIAEVLKVTRETPEDIYAVFIDSTKKLEWWPWSECEEYHEPKTQDLIIRLTIDAFNRPAVEHFVETHDISGMCDIKEVTNDNH